MSLLDPSTMLVPRTTILVILTATLTLACTPKTATKGGEKAESDGSEQETQSVVVSADVKCTEMKCTPEDPCCNDCSLAGWVLADEPGSRVMFAAKAKPAPSCAPDGCGQGCASLQAEVTRNEAGVVTVQSWTPVAEAR